MDNKKEIIKKETPKKDSIRDTLSVWKRLYSYICEFKKDMITVVILMCAISLVDILYPHVFAYAIDHFVTPHRLEGYWKIGLIYVLSGIVVPVTVFFFHQISCRVEAALGHSLRKKQFAKVNRLSISFFDSNPVGDILARMGSATNKVAEILPWTVVDMSWATSYMAFQITAMVVLNVKLALIVIIGIPLVGIVTFLLNQKMLAYERVVRGTTSEITALISDGIYGAMTSKTLCREDLNIQDFKQKTGYLRKQAIQAEVIRGLYVSVPLVFESIPLALLIAIGGMMVKGGEISVGTLMVFIAYAGMVYEPVAQYVFFVATMFSAQAAGERVLGLLDQEEDVSDTDDVLEKYGDAENHKVHNWEDIHGDIEFQNVSFYYKEGEHILKDFCLSVKKGQSVALIGKTGAGKSTIVNLLCRFYEPKEGQVLIDGVDYRNRSQNWLHANLGYVLQTPFLFTGTIEENIKYGHPEATREAVEEAAKAVHAHEFIMEMENGYETEVGEGGARLSGGQRQLISFARAVLRQPSIFVLDEATSSVDAETESLIQDAVDKMLKDRTSFIVAHRLSTVKHADVILVLDDGRIIERGNHRELMVKKGRYYKLYTNQFYEDSFKNLMKKAGA